MFHLGWLVDPTRDDIDWAGNRSTRGIDDYLDLASALERSAFDFLAIGDGPGFDPTALVTVLGRHTATLGLVPTFSTSLWSPLLAERMLATLDDYAEGRIGAHLSDPAAQWVPQWLRQQPLLRHQPPLRHQPGANVPVICSISASHDDLEFAAGHADAVIAPAQGIEQMKALRDDVSRRVTAFGRKSSECPVLFVIDPVVAETDADAEAEFDRRTTGPSTIRLVGSPATVADRLAGIVDAVGGDGFVFGSAIDRRTVAAVTDGLIPVLRKRGLVRSGYSSSSLRGNLLEGALHEFKG
jgi:alkanesulfonate monooxygenase SsuD/methylene tetrahydromethanopterin reductase-like flavin-dependent oxidoreductase (luciferase family)